MPVFISVITRPFLVFGVFVGLFMGVRRHAFFWGGHFGEIGPFYAHFSPEASKRDFLGSEILFLATGAAGGRPPTGLGLGPGQAAVCLGSPICEDVRVFHGVSIDAGVDMRWMVAWYC
jgi:hypothetical protein